jgi:hypothetical protein
MASDLRLGAACVVIAAGVGAMTDATAATGTGSGNLYVCTDAHGKTITSDQPPPECADRPIRELRTDGSLRRVIEPPLNAAQREQKAAEDRRKAEEEGRRRDQARRDKALLDAYSDEKEIEDARTRAVDGRRVIIDRARKRMDELQRERKKLDDEAEFYAKRDKPEKLKRDTEAELKRINERFDADLKRYRQLVQTGGKPAPRSASTASR